MNETQDGIIAALADDRGELAWINQDEVGAKEKEDTLESYYRAEVENKLKLDETKLEVLVNGKPSSQKEAIKLVERSMSKWEARRKRWQAYKNDSVK